MACLVPVQSIQYIVYSTAEQLARHSILLLSQCGESATLSYSYKVVYYAKMLYRVDQVLWRLLRSLECVLKLICRFSLQQRLIDFIKKLERC